MFCARRYTCNFKNVSSRAVVVTPYNNAGPGTPANITVTTLIPSGQNMYIYNYVYPAGVRLWDYVCSNTIYYELILYFKQFSSSVV